MNRFKDSVFRQIRRKFRGKKGGFHFTGIKTKKGGYGFSEICNYVNQIFMNIASVCHQGIPNLTQSTGGLRLK